MIPNELKKVTEKNILELIDNKIPEGRQLDYKERLPSKDPKEKIDFLKLVCSFANTDGGDIVYGISDEHKEGKPTGLPEKIIGLKVNEGSNIDSERLRLQDIINNGISPQVTFQTQVIDCSDGQVLIIRVDRSWNPPHIVQERSGFFHRIGSQCKEMDYQMIKNSFLLNNSYAEQAQRFRKERLVLIESYQTPIMLEIGVKIVLHLFPLSSFHTNRLINLKKIQENGKLLPPLGTLSYNSRHNADGFLSYQEETKSYAQIFRNGVIESLMVCGREASVGPWIKSTIQERLEKYLQLLSNVDVRFPFIVMVSLLEVRGKQVVKGNEYQYPFSPVPIDRDRLLLPDIVLENISSDLDSQLLPVFDALWQASGWPDSY